MSRPRRMAGAEALRGLGLAGVLTLAPLGLLTLPRLALLGFVGACGTVAYSVAAPALVPALVPAAALAAANGRIELARTVAFASGPAGAGRAGRWTGGAPHIRLTAAGSAPSHALGARRLRATRTPGPLRAARDDPHVRAATTLR